MSHEDLSDPGTAAPESWWAAGTEADGTAPTRAWVVARGRVSGLLLALREAELEDRAALPGPLTGGAVLRAWAAAESGSWRADVRDALELVGAAARLLGTRLCVLRSTGAGDVVTAVLQREADVHGCTPERLVAELARVHGVLSAPDRVSAAKVWHALDDPTDQ